jgi:outer membrane protein TolC
MRAGLVGVVLALFLACTAAGAEGQGADASSLVRLEDYLRYAALHNAGLEAKFEQWRAAVERVPQAEALPDPKFTYGYFIEEVETRVGPQRQRAGIMQVFPWFGKIAARTDAAAAMAVAAGQMYEVEKLKLFYEVKDGFYDTSAGGACEAGGCAEEFRGIAGAADGEAERGAEQGEIRGAAVAGER